MGSEHESTQSTLEREHVTTPDTLARNHVTTQDTLTREHIFSTQGTQFSRLFHKSLEFSRKDLVL